MKKRKGLHQGGRTARSAPTVTEERYRVDRLSLAPCVRRFRTTNVARNSYGQSMKLQTKPDPARRETPGQVKFKPTASLRVSTTEPEAADRNHLATFERRSIP